MSSYLNLALSWNNDVCHCEDKKRKHSEIIPGDPLMVGGKKGVQQKLWRGVSMEEERWLNGCTPDCKSVVLGSNPAPRQHIANSISTEVDSHLGWHSTVCWPLRGRRGFQYTQKPLKIYRKKILWPSTDTEELWTGVSGWWDMKKLYPWNHLNRKVILQPQNWFFICTTSFGKMSRLYKQGVARDDTLCIRIYKRISSV